MICSTCSITWWSAPLTQGSSDLDPPSPCLNHGTPPTSLRVTSPSCGGILKQGVLEDINHSGRGAAAKDQLGGDELIEALQQNGLRHLCDVGEQIVGELASDDRADMRDFLGDRKAIEARHQQCFQRAGESKNRRRSRDLARPQQGCRSPVPTLRSVSRKG